MKRPPLTPPLSPKGRGDFQFTFFSAFSGYSAVKNLFGAEIISVTSVVSYSVLFFSLDFDITQQRKFKAFMD